MEELNKEELQVINGGEATSWPRRWRDWIAPLEDWFGTDTKK